MSTTVGPRATAQIIKLGDMSSSVHRLWIGATALMTRPTIDYFNGDVDKETRKYSAAKTALKIIITVLNGVFTRFVAERVGIQLVKKGIIKPIHDVHPEKFAKGAATAVSFIATMLSVFTLDIPLINWGLNVTLDHLDQIFSVFGKKKRQRLPQSSLQASPKMQNPPVNNTSRPTQASHEFDRYY